MASRMADAILNGIAPRRLHLDDKCQDYAAHQQLQTNKTHRDEAMEDPEVQESWKECLDFCFAGCDDDVLGLATGIWFLQVFCVLTLILILLFIFRRIFKDAYSSHRNKKYGS